MSQGDDTETAVALRTGERREAALYAPVKEFLERQGYEVKGEVKGCDVVARRGDEPPIIVDDYFSFADDASGRHKAICLGLIECIALEATTEISVAGGSLNPGRHFRVPIWP